MNEEKPNWFEVVREIVRVSFAAPVIPSAEGPRAPFDPDAVAMMAQEAREKFLKPAK